MSRNRLLLQGLVIACALLSSRPVQAVAEGEYGPVDILKNEASLMKTVGEYEDLFLRRGYRYGSPEVQELVSRIGGRLAPPPTDPYIKYRFHVLRDPDVNAFALPDGQVYVNTGLLAAVQNEAQLAAVLAHEVHHTAGHHGILEYRSIRRKSVGGMILGPFTLGLSDIFLALSVYGHSRLFEEEADRKGLPKMLESGYDPREMAAVFEIMQQDPEEENPKRSTAWSTHPQLQDRAVYCREQAAALLKGTDAAALRVEAAGYRRMVRRLSLETVQDLIAADYPRTAVAMAARLVAEDGTDADRHVALGDARRALGARGAPGGESAATNAEKKENLKARQKLTREERETERLNAPEGMAHLRRNLEESRKSYQLALEIDAGSPAAHRGMGYVLMGLDDPEGAGREFLVYLRARADAVDRPIILGHLKKLTETLKNRSPSHVQETAQ